MSKETAKYFEGPTQWERLQEDNHIWVSEERARVAKRDAERASRFETIRVYRANGLSDKEIGVALGDITGQAVRNFYKEQEQRQKDGRATKLYDETLD